VEPAEPSRHPGKSSELTLHQRNDGRAQTDLEQLAGQRREEPAAQHVADADRRGDHDERIALHAAA